jgi:DNA-binding NarL/FixJ family response regulator
MKGSSQNATAVFLLDDHPLVRQGLAVMLEQSGFKVAGEADSINETLNHPRLKSAQVLILDVSLEQASGVDLIPALCRRGIRVVVYSMHEDSTVVRRAVAAGASGYVTKRETARALIEAVRAVAAGGSYMSPRATAALAQHAAEPDLSRQQQELYDLLGQGCDAEEIANRLRVSRRTVETYCTRLMDKLGADGMKELRRRAIADRQQRARQ